MLLSHESRITSLEANLLQPAGNLGASRDIRRASGFPLRWGVGLCLSINNCNLFIRFRPNASDCLDRTPKS